MTKNRSSYGLGRYAPAENDVYLAPQSAWLAGGLPPLIYCHGVGGTPAASREHANPGEVALLNALAQHFQILAPALGGTSPWANDTSMARMGDAKTYLQGTHAAKAGKALVVGMSMGGATALAWARANPTLVQAVACVIPALDLEDIRANNRGGNTASLNAAYGGAYSNVTHGPTKNPVLFAASLSAPVGLWTASDDAICVPSTADAFVTARPATTRTNVGALGHTQAAITAAVAGVVAFCLANSP